jgi:phage gp16-like protein
MSAQSMHAVDGPKARNRELAQIHIAVAELGWSDEDYRAILQTKTGKRSSGELDSTGRKRFIAHLKACGWTGHKAPAPQRLSKQQWHVRMLWKDLGRAGALVDTSDAALNTFIEHQVHVSDLRFLGTSQASAVIEALKSWLKRASKHRA